MGVHAIAAVGLLASGLGAALQAAGIIVLIVHAVRRAPRPVGRLVRHPDGAWSLPERGVDRLVLGAGTAAGPFWVRLRLVGPRARPVKLLLLKDQLDAETWRRLQAEVRRARPARGQ